MSIQKGAHHGRNAAGVSANSTGNNSASESANTASNMVYRVNVDKSSSRPSHLNLNFNIVG